MKRLRVFLSVIILFLSGCTLEAEEEPIPHHLVFQGESEKFQVTFEVKQSPNKDKPGFYHYLERPMIKYTGENSKKLERGTSFKWHITGADIIESGASGSNFKPRFGVVPPQTWTKTTASDSFLKKDVSLEFKMKWGQKSETIPLHLTKVSYNDTQN